MIFGGGREYYRIFLPSKTASTRVYPSYRSFSRKKGASCHSKSRKILSPSHWGSVFRNSRLTHCKSPSSQVFSSPSKPSAVNRYIYSPSQGPLVRKVTIPRHFQLVRVRPVSSLASRRRHSSGVSSGSNLPPMPIHLS